MAVADLPLTERDSFSIGRGRGPAPVAIALVSLTINASRVVSHSLTPDTHEFDVR